MVLPAPLMPPVVRVGAMVIMATAMAGAMAMEITAMAMAMAVAMAANLRVGLSGWH